MTDDSFMVDILEQSLLFQWFTLRRDPLFLNCSYSTPVSTNHLSISIFSEAKGCSFNHHDFLETESQVTLQGCQNLISSFFVQTLVFSWLLLIWEDIKRILVPVVSYPKYFSKYRDKLLQVIIVISWLWFKPGPEGKVYYPEIISEISYLNNILNIA